MLSLIKKNSPKDISTEAYRTLRTNFQFFTKDKNVKSLVLTSTESGEGASVTTRNLALSLSLSGKKVLVIDCDLRKPSIHEYFNTTNNVGFANLIIEKLPYKDIIKEYSDTLHIITAGKTTINPADLLNIEYISPIFGELQKQYDIILIDSPPVINFTDAQLLSAVSDGVIIVVSIGRTHKKLCQKAIQLLQNVNADILGIVLNKNIKKLEKCYKKKRASFYKKDKLKRKKSMKTELAVM